MKFYTGQRVQVVGTGEFATVRQVIPATNICIGDGVVVEDSNGDLRTFTEAWLFTEPEGDCDPFDNASTL